MAAGLGALICYGMTGEEMQGMSLWYLVVAIAAGAGIQAVLPYDVLHEKLTIAETIEETESKPEKRRLKIQDLETEELPEEEATTAEESKEIQLIENPLPLPKKHVPRVLDYRLNNEGWDYDYPVSDDDDFDH